MSEETQAKKAPEKVTKPVGSVVTGIKNGATVVRPDGERNTVRGRSYVLDVPGTFDVDGTLHEVKG